ncbi:MULTISPECIES: hypothetical protein [unclassified Pseudomonas]|uniref:hypothetical protein n=1 Tax=unclassified Pseudomonas TaxID=196821 RepID=UPI001912E239|nr:MULTISPECIES: hypothetical protein [unclassified Pseudomonas]
MGKVITLGFLSEVPPWADQPGVVRSARYAKGSQVKRGALYNPANAQASTHRVFSSAKSAAFLWDLPFKAG